MGDRDASMAIVEGHRFSLTDLGRALYPACGFTKRDAIFYYYCVAESLLPHLVDRPVALLAPTAGGSGRAWEVGPPRGAPPWVRTMRVRRQPRHPGADSVARVDHRFLITDASSLLWAANLGALELRVPLWRAGDDPPASTVDTLAFHLEPTGQADAKQCASLALSLRDALAAAGLDLAHATTDGRVGLQVLAALATPLRAEAAHELARRTVRSIGPSTRGTRTSGLGHRRRGGVRIKWHQDDPSRTVVAPYSLSAGGFPWVATPITWDELDAVARHDDAAPLRFTTRDALARVERLGDLLAPLVRALAPGAARAPRPTSWLWPASPAAPRGTRVPLGAAG